MDSHLILPSSLKDLCKSFNINKEESKIIFPLKLNDINYKGLVPDIKLFSNINKEEFEKYKKQYGANIWVFKEESIAYCTLDCISLHKIISKFNQLIFRNFKLNITNYPTLPSLAFNLFKSKYLKKDTIHMLSGEIADKIRQSYSGGAVDMYLSKSFNNKQIYAYVVNSLYPFVMKNNMFPVGDPIYFEKLRNRNLTDNLDLFGHFYCKIIAPENLLHPILQLHHKTPNGLRTIAPCLWQVNLRVGSFQKN